MPSAAVVVFVFVFVLVLELVLDAPATAVPLLPLLLPPACLARFAALALWCSPFSLLPLALLAALDFFRKAALRSALLKALLRSAFSADELMPPNQQGPCCRRCGELSESPATAQRFSEMMGKNRTESCNSTHYHHGAAAPALGRGAPIGGDLVQWDVIFEAKHFQKLRQAIL